VRAAIGPDIALMVDANQAWTAAEAIGRGRRLEEFQLG
jgi:L-alanine-DL-glutamate epimerase-like enolase superfamily enzyme